VDEEGKEEGRAAHMCQGSRSSLHWLSLAYCNTCVLIHALVCIGTCMYAPAYPVLLRYTRSQLGGALLVMLGVVVAAVPPQQLLALLPASWAAAGSAVATMAGPQVRRGQLPPLKMQSGCKCHLCYRYPPCSVLDSLHVNQLPIQCMLHPLHYSAAVLGCLQS
jgi:hypothetical protein